MQRNLEPMRKQVEGWQRGELTDVMRKFIHEAFVDGRLEAPKNLARTVHDLYFEPKYDEFRSRTICSLSNAFTSGFKALEPIPQFKATAKLGEFRDRANIRRIENGVLLEHWDVIQDEATRAQSKSRNPMFGTSFPLRANEERL